MTKLLNQTFAFAALGLGLLMTATLLSAPVLATESGLQRFAGEAAPAYADPTVAVDAFKSALAANDMDGLARLLGLDPLKLKSVEGISGTFDQMRAGAARLTSVEGSGDRRVLKLGDKLWPLPFPLARRSDGQWAFDTRVGLEEIVNRRVGENELQAIATTRAYVVAQRDYASADHDSDGVLEYAQKLVSSEGTTDGLYWSSSQGDGESPAGAFISQASLDKTKSGDGYFGYKFRILRGQGKQIAGGRYDYIINGNMIAGFALIAWPARYAETGVHTFAVNQAGIVYEKDLGPDTAAAVEQIRRFNPDKSWDIVDE